MLEKFREAKKQEIEELKKRSFSEAHRRHEFGRFSRAIQNPLSVIAEYKRASPSQGDIAPHLRAGEVAASYAEGGASAISVLTEETFFKGRLEFLEEIAQAVGLPLLRKDFIFDSLQIKATIESAASALLLIVRLTPDVKQLEDLRLEAEESGLDAVVEIFDRNDLELARRSGARIIQVNARDLDTLKVDAKAQLELIQKERGQVSGEIWIAASGVESSDDLRAIQAAGFEAALIGTSLMKSGQPGAALKNLLEGLRR